MQQYLDVLKKVMETGVDIEGRNGGTRKIFTEQMRFKMSDGFPAVTTKKLAFRTMAAELFWFMSGYNDNNELNRLGCKIWDGNTNADYWKPKAQYDGDLGRVYGVQWRSWPTKDGQPIDQIQQAVEMILNNPSSRRIMVNAWNVGEVPNMALPPCHALFQFYVAEGKLSWQLYQRSADLFLGVPFNIASYALLSMMMAQVTGLEVGDFVHTFGDAHIYHNHFDQVNEQLSRKPFPLPQMRLNPNVKNIFDFKYEDFTLENYLSHPSIKAPIAV